MPPSRSLGLGLVAGIVANVLWATTFLIAYVMPAGVPSTAIAAGRYIAFGLISLALLPRGWRAIRALGWRDWLIALVFAATGTVGQFILVLVSEKYSDGPTSTIVFGVLPVTLALYGNLRRREVPMRRLAWPLVVTAAGIGLLAGEPLLGHHVEHPGLYALGVGFALLGVASWTWYAEANASYLARNPQLTTTDWAGAQGIGCLLLSLAMLPFVGVQLRGSPALSGRDWAWLIGVSVVCGVLVSWLAIVLWNRASVSLPVSLAGQLMVVGTIAGVVMVHLVTLSRPGWWELGGLVVSTAGVLMAIRVTMPRAEASVPAVIAAGQAVEP